MNTEQRAREILAAEYERGGASVMAKSIRAAHIDYEDGFTRMAIRAITRALESLPAGAGEAVAVDARPNRRGVDEPTRPRLAGSHRAI